MTKKKILFILPQTQQGGAETQLIYLLKGLKKSKYELHLGLLYDDPQLKEEFESIKGVKITRFDKKGFYDIGVYKRIAEYAKTNNIEIIQTLLGNQHAYIPAKMTGCKAVGGIRGTYDKEYSMFEKIRDFFIQKRFTKNGTIVLVSNSYKGKEVYLKKKFDSKKIFVIPNGIDYKKYSQGNKNKITKKLKLKGKNVLTIVGRIVDGKNHEWMVEKFKEIKGKSILLIVGEGPKKDELIEKVKKQDLEKQILVLGNRKDVPDILAATDVFVFPSQYPEGWSNVLGEAMSAGVPIVTFDVGDARKIIDNKINGFVIGEDVEKFVPTVNMLLDDKKLRLKIGKNASQKAKNEFSVQKMVESYNKLYDEVL